MIQKVYNLYEKFKIKIFFVVLVHSICSRLLRVVRPITCPPCECIFIFFIPNLFFNKFWFCYIHMHTQSLSSSLWFKREHATKGFFIHNSSSLSSTLFLLLLKLKKWCSLFLWKYWCCVKSEILNLRIFRRKERGLRNLKISTFEEDNRFFSMPKGLYIAMVISR